jgi:hypothetical protein
VGRQRQIDDTVGDEGRLPDARIGLTLLIVVR